MRDLCRYSRQTNFRLAVGGILILFIVGIGLIYLIYGKGAALLGFTCLVLGLAPMLLIWLALLALEWVAKRADRD